MSTENPTFQPDIKKVGLSIRQQEDFAQQPNICPNPAYLTGERRDLWEEALELKYRQLGPEATEEQRYVTYGETWAEYGVRLCQAESQLNPQSRPIEEPKGNNQASFVDKFVEEQREPLTICGGSMATVGTLGTVAGLAWLIDRRNKLQAKRALQDEISEGRSRWEEKQKRLAKEAEERIDISPSEQNAQRARKILAQYPDPVRGLPEDEWKELTSTPEGRAELSRHWRDQDKSYYRPTENRPNPRPTDGIFTNKMAPLHTVDKMERDMETAANISKHPLEKAALPIYINRIARYVPVIAAYLREGQVPGDVKQIELYRQNYPQR